MTMIERTYVDWDFNQDERNNYKFGVNRSEHQFTPGTRVKLTVLDRPDSQYGTVIKVEDDALIIHTDEWLDISEEYSIE